MISDLLYCAIIQMVSYATRPTGLKPTTFDIWAGWLGAKLQMCCSNSNFLTGNFNCTFQERSQPFCGYTSVGWRRATTQAVDPQTTIPSELFDLLMV